MSSRRARTHGRFSTRTLSLAATGIVAGDLMLACRAPAQTFSPPTQSPIRPMVLIQLPQQNTEGVDTIDATEAGRVAVGIFDTGDPFNTFSVETFARINPGYFNGPANAGQNTEIGVAKRTTWNGSGWLGSTIGNGEDTFVRNAANQPTHIFQTISTVNRTDPLNNGQFRNPTWYYNNRNSENHIGTAFVSLPAAGGGGRLVAEVDPINARTMPFFYDNIPSDVTRPNPNPPPANIPLQGPTAGLDDRTTSVSFLAPNDPRVPSFVAGRSANPGNTFRVALTPTDLNNTAQANFNVQEFAVGSGNAAAFFDRGESIGSRPFATLTATNGANNTASSYLFDTGAPTTAVPTAVFNALPGGGNTRVLPSLSIPTVGGGNMVFTNVSVSDNGGNVGLLGANIFNMFGQFWDFQRNELVLTGAVKPDILFAVDGTSLGMSRTGVNQKNRFNGGARPAGRSVFRTSQTGSNATFVDDAAIQLVAGDQMLALSTGKDAISRDLSFSVSSASPGQAGSAVAQQAGRNQQGGDIFNTTTASPNRVNGTNTLTVNQELLGLGVGGNGLTRTHMGPGFNAPANDPQDELNDFELDRPRVIDPLAANTVNGTLATPAQLTADVFRLYFSLGPNSPSIGGVRQTSDILVSSPAGAQEFADWSTMGIGNNDILDALVLEDKGTVGTMDPGVDTALFSLRFNSPTLNDRLLSGADVFITHFDGTFEMFATAESMGLDFTFGEIDGLDTVPEPGSILLALGAGVIGMLNGRRRRLISV